MSVPAASPAACNSGRDISHDYFRATRAQLSTALGGSQTHKDYSRQDESPRFGPVFGGPLQLLERPIAHLAHRPTFEAGLVSFVQPPRPRPHPRRTERDALAEPQAIDKAHPPATDRRHNALPLPWLPPEQIDRVAYGRLSGQRSSPETQDRSKQQPRPGSQEAVAEFPPREVSSLASSLIRSACPRCARPHLEGQVQEGDRVRLVHLAKMPVRAVDRERTRPHGGERWPGSQEREPGRQLSADLQTVPRTAPTPTDAHQRRIQQFQRSPAVKQWRPAPRPGPAVREPPLFLWLLPRNRSSLVRAAGRGLAALAWRRPCVCRSPGGA